MMMIYWVHVIIIIIIIIHQTYDYINPLFNVHISKLNVVCHFSYE